MSRTYNEYYFEKQEVQETLLNLGINTRLLRVLHQEQGLGTIEYLITKNAHRKFNWLDDAMIQAIIEEGTKDE